MAEAAFLVWFPAWAGKGGEIFFLVPRWGIPFGEKKLCECALKRPVIGLSLFLLPTPTFISSCPIAGGRRTVGRKLMLQLPFQPPLIKKELHVGKNLRKEKGKGIKWDLTLKNSSSSFCFCAFLLFEPNISSAFLLKICFHEKKTPAFLFF